MRLEPERVLIDGVAAVSIGLYEVFRIQKPSIPNIHASSCSKPFKSSTKQEAVSVMRQPLALVSCSKRLCR